LQQASAMRALAAVLLAVAALAGAPSHARAQADFLLGDWQQLSSNAGPCPTCQISFSQSGGALTVTANNGWSARVDERPRSGVVAAVGSGGWQAGGGRLAGKTFDIDLELRGDRIYMSMRIDTGGRPWIVRAIYGRAWLGS
jgi:hypothetical protein